VAASLLKFVFAAQQLLLLLLQHFGFGYVFVTTQEEMVK
jgi:hypothetical protein